MPRYFFHVHDGHYDPDIEGTELVDADAARREAIRLAGQLLDNHAQRLALGELWFMEVMDAEGLVLFRLDFHVTESPALRHDKATKGELL